MSIGLGEGQDVGDFRVSQILDPQSIEAGEVVVHFRRELISKSD